MFIVHARVELGTHKTAPVRVDAVALCCGVLVRATTADRLQHVHASVDYEEEGADLVLFLSQTSLRVAESIARRLVTACLADCPATADWTLERCGVTLPGALASLLFLSEGRTLPRQRPAIEDY